MENIKKYHLHQNDYSKLHFEINDAKSYFEKNVDHAIKPHRHSFYQLIWFKQRGRHYIDYEVKEHEADVVFFVNPNQVHHFCPNSNNEGFLYHFNDHFIEQFNTDLMKRLTYSIFNEMSPPFIKLSEKDSNRFDVVTHIIQDEITTNEDLVKELIFTFFSSLLFYIERLNRKEAHINIDMSIDFRLAFEFKKLIYENMETFLSINQFCNLLHISHKKLTSASKQYLHDTPANVIQHIKILEAKRRLSNKKSNIQEIAYDLGFNQATYFTKYFKKNVGLSPKAFQIALP